MKHLLKILLLFLFHTIFLLLALLAFYTTGMMKGSDKGSFYNENFLRGLPHLSKKTKRTGGVKIVDDTKLDTNVTLEPNLWSISEEHPVPERIEPDSSEYLALIAVNECVVTGGWKAKTPVLHDVSMHHKPSPAIVPASAANTCTIQESSYRSSGQDQLKSSSGESTENIVTTAGPAQLLDSSSLANSSLTSSAESSTSPVRNAENQSNIAPDPPNQPCAQNQQPIHELMNNLVQQLSNTTYQQQQQSRPLQQQTQWNNSTHNNAMISFLSSQQQPGHLNAFTQQQRSQNPLNNPAASFLGGLLAPQQTDFSNPSSLSTSTNPGFAGFLGANNAQNGNCMQYQQLSQGNQCHQQALAQSPNNNIFQHQCANTNANTNAIVPTIPLSVQDLLEQVILHGARLGAESTTNQNNSSIN